MSTNQCYAFKNKLHKDRCPHKIKEGKYCGTHLRSKNVVDYFDSNDNIFDNVPIIPATEIRTKKKIKILNNGYEFNVLIDNLNSENNESYFSNLKQSKLLETVNYINNTNPLLMFYYTKFLNKLNEYINMNMLDPFNSKYFLDIDPNIWNNKMKYIEDFSCKKTIYILYLAHKYVNDFKNKNLNYIIKIQSLIKRFNIKNRMNCVNSTDIYTMEHLALIDSKYFYKIKINEKKYGFDIRSLKKWFDNSNLNPYTMEIFDAQIISDFNKFYENKNNIEERINIVLSTEQQFLDKVINLFQNINLIGNYTYHEWFLTLSLAELKKLYLSCEDIWNYRAQLTQQQKHKIVKNGCWFSYNKGAINKITQNKIRHLQLIILNEVERIIEEGETSDDKALGINFFLTGLVEVSPDAAMALPHLIQIN